ncbi:terpene synthase 10-like [Olea europaea subsp. europaea]|uniref:Terpene synthase 10-like n=1 Tax=Olea europaea subsp. europaea TaxID=158383 RepID=A0A8S0R9J7_OLEEU|nr:terpene synthase 10-like [Olea europaea subsp. europaea]
MQILRPISVCSFKTELPKMEICFALGTTTDSLASNAKQYRILASTSYNQTVIRRSGKYTPPIWEFDYIQSLNSEYTEERYKTRASEMKMQVKMMLDETMEPLDQLELIDNLERLGISYHFEDEIEQILAFINRKYSKSKEPKIKDLYATALEFRLLRQHGFNVSQERFDCLKNEKGDFKPRLCNDTKGLLQLYEASFLSIEGESTLEMAREFTIKHLEDKSVDDIHCDPLVHHALEIPLHWTIPRAEAGWDVSAIEQLPDYMQIFYLALNNFINEMAYDVLREKGIVIIPYLRKVWTDLCKAYLQEAKWCFTGYTPTMEEHMENALISISAHVILSHSFFSVTNPIEKEAIQCLEKYPDIVRWSATILRLADDLATSSDELERGDVPKSIQCYMNETGASEDELRKHIRFLICETWKKINKGRDANCPFSQTFIEIAVNLARMVQYMYQYGDGHGIQNHETKDRILALLFEPIPLN